MHRADTLRLAESITHPDRTHWTPEPADHNILARAVADALNGLDVQRRLLTHVNPLKGVADRDVNVRDRPLYATAAKAPRITVA